MNQYDAKRILLNKPFTIEDFPFGEGVAVFKVKTKMFATLSLGKMGKGKQVDGSGVYWMNLKCEPNHALELRDIFPSVIPGYHMNKIHWNTVILDGSIPRGEIERMIDHSFDLVVAKMTKKDQQSILVHL